MGERLTPQQEQAVKNRGGKLLVSAAAGSGKTKVLVDRLMGYINDPVKPSNVDDFLIITYTKAAAAELRAKIAAKLTELIAENPQNRHLQRQMQRLYLAKISTIHAFCSDLLREFAYKLDISVDFRMADEVESTQLQVQAMGRVLEDAYTSDDTDFYAFLDTQGLGRNDMQVPEIVLEVYEKSRCHLNPDQWLDNCINAANVAQDRDASETVWGAFLIRELFAYLDMQIEAIGKCVEAAKKADHMEKAFLLLSETKNQLQHLRASKTWDEIIERLHIDYGTLTFSKKCDDVELIEQIKAVRNHCKSGLASKLKPFSNSSEQVISDLKTTLPAAIGLVKIVKKFSQTYDAMKRSRHIVDFSDLEHKSLDLLVGKSRNSPTVLADEIGSRFREIMVDEYQDSNAVQDCIFRALTGKHNNCFMVGDVKQSIYQFRLADPSIFLEKYKTYAPAETAADGQGRKVLLNKNFRSSGGVIDAVNCVFETCMTEQVGGLDYGDDESLKEGLEHTQLPDPEVELYAVDIQSSTYPEEAAFVAERVAQLLDGKHMVREKDVLRPIVADDIVILLRSPGSVGMYFKNAIEKKGIRCSTGSSSDLFLTEEISVLRSLLKVIDNPQQDIPMTAVITSRVFGITADDLAAIRAKGRKTSIYDSLVASDKQNVREFLNLLAQLRQEARFNSLMHILNKILYLTRIDSVYSALDHGDERVENIQTLYQLAASVESAGKTDLGQFLEYLDNLEVKGFSVNEENPSNAVRIMSIHKSKGLEFPVVFLCGLSKAFNTEDSRAPVLCDNELGFGLCCADMKNRIKYPTIAKNAIAAKMKADSISEEMRVLYVAMTRARDRLIMTHALKKPEVTLGDYAYRLDISPRLLLTSGVNCAGDWVLLSALLRQEAKAFFSIATRPVDCVKAYDDKWLIDVMHAPIEESGTVLAQEAKSNGIDSEVLNKIQSTIDFVYQHKTACSIPSKQTATQLKGRQKDLEIADGAVAMAEKRFRKPAFIENKIDGRHRGNAVHALFQRIRFENCDSPASIRKEILDLVAQGMLSEDYGKLINPEEIIAFFESEIGKKVLSAKEVLREFKFSILDDSSRYFDGVVDEQILLQGVVDCAIHEDDGLIVIDFKTDAVTENTISDAVSRYKAQVETYSYALERIFRKPVKMSLLYFFRMNRFVEIS